jgi:hypothetical protein
MASTLMTTATSFQKQSHVIHKDYLAERDNIPEQWRAYFNEYTAPKKGRFVQFMPIYGLGRFAQKQEGTAPLFDAPREGPMFFTEFSTYALGVSITKEGRIEDPLDLFAKAPRLLSKAARDTKDKITVGMYNFAFGPKRLPDGQYLISANHPMDPIVTGRSTNGVVITSGSGIYQSNSLGNQQLTPEVLMAGDVLSQSWLDDRGKKDERELIDLVIPNNPVLVQIAQEIVGTPTHPYTIARKENPQHNRWTVKVNRDLASQYQYFLQAAKGEPGEDCHALTVWMRWNDGSANGWKTYIDNITENRVVISSFRIAQGAWDWKGIVGSLGGAPVSG